MTVTTSPGGTTGACEVGYRVTGEWPGGFQAEVTVRDTGGSAVDGWALRWAFSVGQRITHLWGGTPVQSGSGVTVAFAPYTASIPASGSVTLGFTGTRSGANPSPTAFALNGADCSVT